MIKGFIKSSFVDYPGRICSTIFVGSCNFRCPYCHNPDIVFNKTEEIPFDQILEYLKKRKHLVEAVCITGGEPTLWKELPAIIKQIKDIGLLVKLDTNGANPSMLKNLINQKLIDYIAFDYKAPLDKYEQATKTKVDIKKIKESINLILSSGIDYEFRTTVHSECTSKEDLITIAKELKGAKRFILQEFKHKTDLIDNSYGKTNKIKKKELEEIKSKIESMGIIGEVKVR